MVTFSLPELDEIAKNEIATKEGSTKPKVSLNFELTRSHLFKLKSASVTIDEKIIEEVIIEKKEEEKKEEADSEEKEEGSDESESEKSGEEKAMEAEKTDEATEESENKEEEPVEKEFRERTETHSYTLEIDETLHGARLLTKD